MIDWQRRGIGRIARASGTTKPSTYRGIVAMLGELYERPDWDTLRAIKDGRLHPLEVYDAYRRQKALPAVEALVGLRARVDGWLAQFEGRTKANYRTGLNRLLRHAGPDVTLAQLPDLVRADKAASRKQAPSFNRAKAAAQAFSRETLGRGHAVYSAIADVEALTERRRERERLSVAAAQRIRAALPEPFASVWWTLCLTGMIVSEYQGDWRVVKDGVEVRGSKAAGRRRVVPLVEPIARHAVSRREFAAHLTALGVESYDARRAYAHWLEEAKIPRARRTIYRGHGPKDTGDLYEVGELSRYRSADAAALKRYLARTSKKSPNVSRRDAAKRREA